MIDVSIIIVNWNTKDLLLNCIESLYRETKNVTMEIIVVDNGSSDGSTEAVETSYPQVTVIGNNENLGFARANNVGISNSKGRYVCLVNSDIKALDAVVDQLCAYMDQHSEIGAIGPKTVNDDMSIRVNTRKFPTLWNTFCETFFLVDLFPKNKLFRGRTMTWFSHMDTRNVDVLSGCFLMVRREVVDKVGVLDDRFFIYGEDTDWCKRMNLNNWDVVFFADTKAIHYAGASSSVAPIRFLIELTKADLQYWKKHHNIIKYSLYQILMLIHFLIRAIGWLLKYIIKSSGREVSRAKYKSYIARMNWLLFNRGRRPVQS
jgi:GT2 family glycosyltransferase